METIQSMAALSARNFLLGASFLVGGASLVMAFKFINKNQKEEVSIEEKLKKKLIKDLFMLGYVTRPHDSQSNDLHHDSFILTYEDWNRIFRVINKHLITCQEELLGHLRKKRISQLKKD